MEIQFSRIGLKYKDMGLKIGWNPRESSHSSEWLDKLEPMPTYNTLLNSKRKILHIMHTFDKSEIRNSQTFHTNTSYALSTPLKCAMRTFIVNERDINTYVHPVQLRYITNDWNELTNQKAAYRCAFMVVLEIHTQQTINMRWEPCHWIQSTSN